MSFIKLLLYCYNLSKTSRAEVNSSPYEFRDKQFTPAANLHLVSDRAQNEVGMAKISKCLGDISETATIEETPSDSLASLLSMQEQPLIKDRNNSNFQSQEQIKDINISLLQVTPKVIGTKCKPTAKLPKVPTKQKKEPKKVLGQKKTTRQISTYKQLPQNINEQKPRKLLVAPKIPRHPSGKKQNLNETFIYPSKHSSFFFRPTVVNLALANKCKLDANLFTAVTKIKQSLRRRGNQKPAYVAIGTHNHSVQEYTTGMCTQYSTCADLPVVERFPTKYGCIILKKT